MRQEHSARDVGAKAGHRDQTPVGSQRVHALRAHFGDQELRVTHFELVLLVELLYQLLQQPGSPIFEKQGGSR